MEILNLALINFRNFPKKKIEFDPSLTLIIGPNGSGKSNILQAIALLSGIRPGHIETDFDLVKFGRSEAKIEAHLRQGFGGQARITLTINFLVIDERYIKKSYLVDSFKKRYLDLASHLSIIVFHPEDLDLVEGSPSMRRHHIDSLLSSVDKDYWRHLSSYNKVVTRRNKILQRIGEGKSKALELNFWDERLLEHAQVLTKKRQELFEFLNFVESADLTSGLTPGVSLGGFSWVLKQSVLNLEKLAKNRERDIAAGVTLSGPHRDDFRFIFRGRDLAYFGSRGEQRMAVLALKLTELEYVSRQKGARPILALDDIFSELDWEHRDTVLSVIGNQQTIITAAEKESVPKEIFKKAKVIEL